MINLLGQMTCADGQSKNARGQMTCADGKMICADV